MEDRRSSNYFLSPSFLQFDLLKVVDTFPVQFRMGGRCKCVLGMKSETLEEAAL